MSSIFGTSIVLSLSLSLAAYPNPLVLCRASMSHLGLLSDWSGSKQARQASTFVSRIRRVTVLLQSIFSSVKVDASAPPQLCTQPLPAACAIHPCKRCGSFDHSLPAVQQAHCRHRLRRRSGSRGDRPISWRASPRPSRTRPCRRRGRGPRRPTSSSNSLRMAGTARKSTPATSAARASGSAARARTAGLRFYLLGVLR